MLRIDNLTVFHAKIQALFGVSLEVPNGSLVVVVGNNGSGKTTLLETIAGLLRPASGVIEFEGKRIDRLPPNERVKLGISLVPQERELFWDMTVADNLRLGAFLRKDRASIRDDLKTAYKYFPVLEERRFQRAGTLSGGEQKMLALGRGLLAKPKMLLLDEPSAGLAPLLFNEILATIAKLRQDFGTTVLLVEQQAHLALPLCEFGYVLQNGIVIASGAPEQLLKDEEIRAAYLGAPEGDAA